MDRTAPRFSNRTAIAAVGMALFALAACSGGSDVAAPEPPAAPAPAPTPSPTPTPTPEPTSIPSPVPEDEPLALNHIQVIGSHNSYHLLPEAPLFEALAQLVPELAQAREYTHRPLTEQLETYGIRQLEIDVYADPEGGLFSTPAANALVGLGPLEDVELAEPGFKVLHVQDYDYSTTCLTFVACLGEVAEWSSANPTHLPVMIMVEFKSELVTDAAAAEGIELPALPWTVPRPPSPEALEALDVEIRSVFGADRLIVPDDVRGGASTLNEAIIENGWPSLDGSRGKVLFSLIGAKVRDLYTADAPSLEGRPMFTNSTPGDPDGAFVSIDDPSDPRIASLVEAGYLVRTRTDVPTIDARGNDPSRRDLALASGAHFLSTDYYLPSELFDSPYFVELPDGAVARCNPVIAPPTCLAQDL